MEDLIEGAMTFEEETDGITIAVQSFFLDEQSEPEENRFFWAYRVKIMNTGAEACQLLRRHWSITDSQGHTEEVHGDGVIGEQPVISPGEAFVYTSGTPLGTPSGFMRGSYDFITESGDPLSANIPAFSLDCPYLDGTIN